MCSRSNSLVYDLGWYWIAASICELVTGSATPSSGSFWHRHQCASVLPGMGIHLSLTLWHYDTYNVLHLSQIMFQCISCKLLSCLNQSGVNQGRYRTNHGLIRHLQTSRQLQTVQTVADCKDSWRLFRQFQTVMTTEDTLQTVQRTILFSVGNSGPNQRTTPLRWPKRLPYFRDK